MKKRYDHIDEIEEVQEVQKFNPFHDNLGRFSSSHGFASYSANPKTKAGAMAIQRSQAGGHGRTLNVHRESKGESIQQNATWLATGQKPKVPAATSRARYQQRKLKQQQAQEQQAQQQRQQTTQHKPAQQTQQAQQQADTQTQTLASKVSGVHLSAGDKLAMQPRDGSRQATTTRKVADDNYQDLVVGKDISATADVRTVKGNKAPIDCIAELHGWNKPSTVENDPDTFMKAAKQSGRMLIRSVDGNGRTGESADVICQKTMTDGDAALGGTGVKAYGSGLYMVDTAMGNSTGRNLAKKISAGQQESYGYGSTQMMATVHPKAKIATPSQAAMLSTQFARMPYSARARFGDDENAFIASKGYDGVKWHSDYDPTAYTTIFNKSALIFYGGVADE